MDADDLDVSGLSDTDRVEVQKFVQTSNQQMQINKRMYSWPSPRSFRRLAYALIDARVDWVLFTFAEDRSYHGSACLTHLLTCCSRPVAYQNLLGEVHH
jgi:hypothetical protein